METAQPGEQALRCDCVSDQAFLEFQLPVSRGIYSLGAHESVLRQRARVEHARPDHTEGGDRKPVYLLSRIPLPKMPKTNVESTVGGGYLLGWAHTTSAGCMMDDTSRVCRKSWRVDVRLSRAEQV